MLRAGHGNPSRVLLLLFAIWVLSPFVALVFATIVSKDWPVLTRTALYGVMLVLTVSSVAIYGDVALGPPRAKTAFAFVVVPPASWLLIAITLSTAALISRGRSDRSGDN
jgi:ACR3 family arsenite efflux pump ArsB